MTITILQVLSVYSNQMFISILKRHLNTRLNVGGEASGWVINTPFITGVLCQSTNPTHNLNASFSKNKCDEKWAISKAPVFFEVNILKILKNWKDAL